MADAPQPSSAASTADSPAFEIGFLRDSSEVPAWGALCGAGFSHRPGDPDRFRKKFVSDPTASLRLTRVARDKSDGRLAGTVRIFTRSWVYAGEGADGTPEKAAVNLGLGEVCTHPDFRGRGIAPLMLADVMAVCEAEEGAVFSSLHAATAVAPLYARFGYAPLRIGYGKLAFSEAALSSAASGESTAAASADSPLHPMSLAASAAFLGRDAAARARLQALHAALNRRLGVAGYTQRDEEYWSRWMPNVCAGRLLLMTAAGSAASAADAAGLDPSAVVAYACILRKGDHYRLADAGADESVASSPAAMRCLLEAAAAASLRADVAEGKLPAAELRTDAAVCKGTAAPSVLLRLCEGGGEGEGEAEGDAGSRLEVEAPEFEDFGWMLRTLPREGSEAVVVALKDAAAADRFLVWMADAF